jgi:peptidoglycan/LPS O-acetylase OafA/YrhL
MAPWLGSPYIDEAHWTISLEMIFYSIVFPIFVFGLVKRIEYVCIAWLTFQLGINIMVINEMPIPSVLITHTLANYAHIFIIGIIFYQMFSTKQTLLRYSIVASCLLIQFFIFDMHYNDVNLVGHSGMIHHGFDTPVLFALVLLFVLFINGKTNIIVFKPLVFLGTISYSLFLIHNVVGTEIIYTMEHYYQLHSWLAILVAIIMSFCLAVLLTFYIELPAMKYIREQYKMVRVYVRQLNTYLIPERNVVQK